MILIDKAKLMNHIENESRNWGEDYDSYQILCDIEDFDTIEAIPIDFLIKTQEEYCKRYGEVYKAVVLNLVEDWRKENESNNGN